MNAITVKNIYNIEVEGLVVNLELVMPGGIAAIKVKTEQLNTRLFPINHHLTNESVGDPDYDPFRQIARDICIYAATGRHPSDKNNPPQQESFKGLGLQRASDYIRDMYGKEIQKT